MVGYIEPFDFRKIIVNLFLGRAELFIFAFLITFAFICAKFGMTNRIFLTLLVISALIFSAILGQAIYILIILVLGYVIFKGIGRLLT